MSSGDFLSANLHAPHAQLKEKACGSDFINCSLKGLSSSTIDFFLRRPDDLTTVCLESQAGIPNELFESDVVTLLLDDMLCV